MFKPTYFQFSFKNSRPVWRAVSPGERGKIPEEAEGDLRNTRLRSANILSQDANWTPMQEIALISSIEELKEKYLNRNIIFKVDQFENPVKGRVKSVRIDDEGPYFSVEYGVDERCKVRAKEVIEIIGDSRHSDERKAAA